MRTRLVALRAAADRTANRDAAVEAVLDAARAGARVVVLPEYAAGFDPRGVGVEHAEPLDGPFVTALREVSGGLVVVAGTLEPAGDRAANTVVAVADGVLVGAYRKVHLYDAFGQRESDRLVAGDPSAPPLVVEVDGLRLGVLTCYDLRFPEQARRLVDGGATVIVVPAAWAGSPTNRELKADHWRTLLRARAIENTCWVLGAPMRGAGVVGDLLAVAPDGRVVGERAVSAAQSGSEFVLDVDVDPGPVDEVRRANPSLVNRRYAVVPRASAQAAE